MAEDLLIKEKGYRQQNKEIEQKAQHLIKEVDYVINNYGTENFMRNCNSNLEYSNLIAGKSESVENITKKEESLQSLRSLQNSVTRNVSLPHIFDQDFLQKVKLESQKNQEDEISKKGNLTNKAIVDLFKAKLELLQNELQIIRVEYKKKCDDYKDLECEHKKFENKSLNETEALKEQINKLEIVNKELQCQNLTLNAENSGAKKDLDRLEKQVKLLIQQSNNYNTRLNRSLENNDKLRNAFKCSQIEEKELRNEIRKLQEEKRISVKNLGKQVQELLQVFKKQMLFIDNLKKQNACLTAMKQLNVTKDDFMKLLDPKI